MDIELPHDLDQKHASRLENILHRLQTIYTVMEDPDRVCLKKDDSDYDASEMTDDVRRVMNATQEANIRVRLFHVASDYYEWSLFRRS